MQDGKLIKTQEMWAASFTMDDGTPAHEQLIQSLTDAEAKEINDLPQAERIEAIDALRIGRLPG